jgi:predicted amidohydrolase YtcJ
MLIVLIFIVAVLLCLACCLLSWAMRNATLILADTLTLNPALPRATAVLCVGGRVVAVGDPSILALAPKANVRDLRGQWLTPGLTDAHIHLTAYGFTLASLRLGDCQTPAEALALVAERLAQPPADPANPWIVGGGQHLNRWQAALGGEYPTKTLLDDLGTERPIYLSSRDGHSAWVNSRALELAGIGVGTPDPAGGRIVRLADGSPSGMLLETAMGLVRSVIPAPSFAATVAAAKAGADKLAQMGFTAAHTMALEPADNLRALFELEQLGQLPLRIWACLPHASLEAASTSALRGGLGERVRLGGIKFFADGALGSRTALMLAPFEGTTDTGIEVDSPATILERGREALALGFSPVVHAIGDRANRQVLDVLAQLAPLARERGVTLRLEHAQHLDPADMGRFAALGVVASMQPIHLVDDALAVEQLLGPVRAQGTYAFRQLLASGAVLAFGSDAPVATPDPVLGMAAAVTRLGADGQPWQTQEATTWAEALAGYTSGAAQAAGWQGWYGRIRPGFAADFTVWDGDPSQGPARPIGVQLG